MAQARPPASSEEVRKRFSAQKRSGTAPEMQLRRALHRAGYRYRVDYPVPGIPRRKIDIAFPRQKLAVFVDGCFWHSCPQHSVQSKSNTEWWRSKLRANEERDRETEHALVAAGWRVLRLWEHELLGEAASVVQAAVRSD